MSIARAWYVQCDRCGNPAEISVEGSKSARDYARVCNGFVRKGGQDICPGCQTPQEKPER